MDNLSANTCAMLTVCVKIILNSILTNNKNQLLSIFDL